MAIWSKLMQRKGPWSTYLVR